MSRPGTPPEWIFVYGTLRIGGVNANRLDPVEVVPARLAGHGLWGRTWPYPFAAPDPESSAIVGEAVRLEPRGLTGTVQRLDEFEGDEYVRSTVVVDIGGRSLRVDAWLAAPGVSLPDSERITSGDWFDR